MRMFLAAAAAVALTTAAAPAFAQATADPYAHTYAAIGYSHYPLTFEEEDEGGEDLQLGAITGKVGGRFNRFFAVEADASIGVLDDSVDILGVGVDIGLESQVGLHLVGMYPISPATDLFARLGYNYFQLEAEIEDADFSDTDDTTAVSLGVGAQHFFDGVNGIRGEYTRYEFQDEGDADALTLSYVRKF
jgi:outer membrane immunogenic protein